MKDDSIRYRLLEEPDPTERPHLLVFKGKGDDYCEQRKDDYCERRKVERGLPGITVDMPRRARRCERSERCA